MATIAELKVRIGSDIRDLERGLAKASRKIRDAGRSMQRVGKTLSMAVTAPLVAMGAASIKSASDFEASMTRIETLVGLSRDQVQGMESDVISLARETSISAQDLSEALFTVTSAGARGSEAMEILERAGKASASGLGETREIARSVTAAMQAYGKENLSAAKATDVFTAVVREGNLRAEELAPSLGRVLGIASQVGVSFQEVGASIATFTRLGVGAEEATTALRGIMNTLISPTDGARKALAGVGLSVEQLHSMIEERGLAETLRMLVTQFDGNAEAISQVIPNVRALSAVLGTAGAQGEQYSQIVDNINNSQGILDEAFERTTETMKFQFNQTINDLRTDAIELGNALMPLATKVLNTLRGAIKRITAFTKQYRKEVIAISLVIGGLGPILAGVGTALVALTSPIGLTIAALAGLASGIAFVADNWEAIKERVSDISWWRNALINMIQFFLDFNPMKLMIDGFNAMLEFFGTATIPNPFKSVSDAIEGLKTETKEYEHQFGSFTDAIINGSKHVMGWISGLTSGFEDLGREIKSTGKLSAQTIQTFEFMSNALNANLFPAVEKTKNSVTELNKQLQVMSDLMAGTLFPTMEKTTGAFDHLRDVGDSVEQTFGNVFMMLVGQGTTALKDIAKVAVNTARQIIAAEIAKGIAATVRSALTNVPFPFNIAAAAGAAGAAAGLFNAVVPKLAQGGLAFGPTLAVVGDNRNARSNPEVIAPLDKLKGLMGGNGAVEVRGIIKGSDIHLSNERGQNLYR